MDDNSGKMENALVPQGEYRMTDMGAMRNVQICNEKYVLNENRALDKLVEACDKPMIGNLVIKHKNAVLKFNLAAFSVLSNAIQTEYGISNGISPTEKVIYCPKYEAKGRLVAETYKVHEEGQYMYTINLYKTNCSMMVNGRKMQEEFVNKVFPKIKEQLSEQAPYLNEKSDTMKEMILASTNSVKEKVKSNERSNLKQEKLAEILPNGSPTKELLDDIKCLICSKTCRTRGTFCDAGNHWVHYSCDKLTENEIKNIENDNESTYVCKGCNNTYEAATDDWNITLTQSDNGEESSKQSDAEDPNQPDLKSEKITKQSNSESDGQPGSGLTVNIPSPDTAATIRKVVKEKFQTNEDEKLNAAQDHDQMSILMQYPPPTLPHPSMPGRKLSPIKGYEDWEKRLNAKEKELQNREKLTKKTEHLQSETIKQLAHLKSYTLGVEKQLNELKDQNKIIRASLALELQNKIKTDANKEESSVQPDTQPKARTNPVNNPETSTTGESMTQMFMTQAISMMEIKHSMKLSEIEMKYNMRVAEMERKMVDVTRELNEFRDRDRYKTRNDCRCDCMCDSRHRGRNRSYSRCRDRKRSYSRQRRRTDRSPGYPRDSRRVRSPYRYSHRSPHKSTYRAYRRASPVRSRRSPSPRYRSHRSPSLSANRRSERKASPTNWRKEMVQTKHEDVYIRKDIEKKEGKSGNGTKNEMAEVSAHNEEIDIPYAVDGARSKTKLPSNLLPDRPQCLDNITHDLSKIQTNDGNSTPEDENKMENNHFLARGVSPKAPPDLEKRE